MSISELMSADHRRCDQLQASFEAAVEKNEIDKIVTIFDDFYAAVDRHFRMEEEVLFPEFESVTGMTRGPTQVMKMEHQQIRQQLESLKLSLQQNDYEKALGVSENLLILTQQHNMKEEQMLYPMTDRSLPNTAATIEKMQAILVVL
ncbi:hemerythrin domain-containing protein [Pelagibaculum spongiae]|nr:hemerythrin domain-containing protein [Pelagibaculum spongiae]